MLMDIGHPAGNLCSIPRAENMCYSMYSADSLGDYPELQVSGISHTQWTDPNSTVSEKGYQHQCKVKLYGPGVQSHKASYAYTPSHGTDVMESQACKAHADEGIIYPAVSTNASWLESKPWCPPHNEVVISLLTQKQGYEAPWLAWLRQAFMIMIAGSFAVVFSVVWSLTKM